MVSVLSLDTQSTEGPAKLCKFVFSSKFIAKSCTTWNLNVCERWDISNYFQ